ncbi:MAG: hypothetical protein PF488_04735 [Patescibacteria group bacterium]|jgi:hypothetical protein|nr:hypothetical protein [Patescibacteria group bacterium]
MRCPIIKTKEYRLGFDNDLEFNGFRGNGIKWETKSKLTFVGFNDENEAEFIGTDKEWDK